MASAVVTEPHYLGNLAAPAAYDTSMPPSMMGNSLPSYMTSHGMQHQGISDQPSYGDNMASISNRTSRSSSLMQPGGMNENRRSLSSLEHLSSRTSFDNTADFPSIPPLQNNMHALSGYSMPPAVQSAGPMANTSYGYPTHQATGAEMGVNHSVTAAHGGNGMFARPSLSNGQLNWSGGYQPSHHGYAMFAGAVGGDNRVIKSEAGLLGGGLSGPTHNADGGVADGGVSVGLYSTPSAVSWSSEVDDGDIGDPLERNPGALISFCFPDASSQPAPDEVRLREVLTPDNNRHFFLLFNNFHGHWPIIHMPTFKPSTAYDGLLLTMIVVGAVYSDRIDIHTQRWLLDIAQHANRRASRICKGQSPGASSTLTSRSDLEEMQALTILHVAHTWHGSEAQRSYARQNLGHLVSIARANGLLQALPSAHPDFSCLHNPEESTIEEDLARWNWHAWIEQEKRARTMYLAYLINTALVLYFNLPPHIEWQQLNLPLPSDDAVWEARTEADCMAALGLNGPAAQRTLNKTGSKRRRQPFFNTSIRVLLHPTIDFELGSTNVYSKFILIHAVHVLIWTVQRQASAVAAAAQPDSDADSDDDSDASSSTARNDQPESEETEQDQSQSSGHTTPDTTAQHSPQFMQAVQTLNNATDKWKQAWDGDVETQYPTTGTPGGPQLPRRIGFCRDGIHFYWLAKLLLSLNRPDDAQISPEARFCLMLRMLKQVRTYVASASYTEGKDIGSVVDIQESYGVEDLTLDMKLLFAPLQQDDTEGTGSVL